ncbi:hypothetical protein BWI93_19160 [Siphonobacter sp. BAB-5385]|uniref:hypothetical protein n=1 Tax=Siphonobacter sp. BAB-5385 TaxID=1864822 RepID=UPI000B9E1A43|nr:hypothetical protein [Siphonobacter sp. BAB-5385]OZI06600.1 hypothetical protein BWI93_19160 [Siphonobacter sp. BAB-5385]
MQSSRIPTIQEGFMNLVQTIHTLEAKKLSLSDSYHIAVSYFPNTYGFQAPYGTFESFKHAWHKSRRAK